MLIVELFNRVMMFSSLDVIQAAQLIVMWCYLGF